MRHGLFAAMFALFASQASAHPLAPALLELTPTAAGDYAVRWRTPAARVQGHDVTPQLPAGCTAVSGVQSRILGGEALEATWTVRCAADLAGQAVAVDGLAGSGIDVVVRIAGNPEFKALLTPDHASVIVSPDAEPVFARYLQFGGQHLLTGADHLLFLLGLLILVPALRALILTVTAFTVGHSLTLALAVLGFVPIRQGWAELAIAATVLVLALEILSPTPSALRRKPWLMAGCFGLIHGLGFAGALRDIGLPAQDIPLSLLGFNLGIELAQLALIGLAMAAGAAASRFSLAWRASPAWARLLPAYVIGSMAACWCLERLQGLGAIL